MPNNNSDRPDYASMNQLFFSGKAPEVQRLTEEAIASGRDVHEVLNDGLIAGMNVVGEDFKRNRVYLPEVVLAARAMKAGMTVLNPLLTAQQGEGDSMGTLVMGTVKGDLHDIGKNLCIMLLRGAGFEVIDLGVDTSADEFIDAVEEHSASLVGMSALLTTTMPNMGRTIEAFIDADLRDDVKIMVGGAPVTPEFADEMGADAYGDNAVDCVEVAKRLAGVAG